MKDYACTEDMFLEDVEQHTMTVLRDDGVFRHIRFKSQDSGTYWFDLITWPGTLCIDGDCGTYVFRRLNDMFQFFRTDRELAKDETLAISPGYWGEKLESIATHGKFKEFSGKKFCEHVEEAFDEWVTDHQPEFGANPDEILNFFSSKNALREELEVEVLACSSEGDVSAMDAALKFESGIADFNLNEAWEWECREYTPHFIWCCYAIAWGVKTYDEAKAATKGAA